MQRLAYKLPVIKSRHMQLCLLYANQFGTIRIFVNPSCSRSHVSTSATNMLADNTGTLSRKEKMTSFLATVAFAQKQTNGTCVLLHTQKRVKESQINPIIRRTLRLTR